MKRNLSLILMSILIAALMLAGCSSASGSGSAAAESQPKVDVTKMSAEEIVKTFQDAGYPIENVQILTAETDKGELLGRPNQYTSKVIFEDSRSNSPAAGSATEGTAGGSIEVFNNAEDAQARYDYIQPITENAMFSQYLYLYENVFLRIDGALTPDQAAQYEAAFISLQNGELPEQFSENSK
ncbi:hypothetical protein [Acetobacterium wieringae]|uniref:hypothetical protein n=1 Tax=Acetobacterium wieringae TaxID=52694 RepID=UPI002034257F|nr:hypothetical protein [Acetobacterium wieringae]URN85823.1 hypothetical protein CHL1_001497 [Acetobacterium wieringae]